MQDLIGLSGRIQKLRAGVGLGMARDFDGWIRVGQNDGPKTANRRVD
jgi:hypothetical protein